jgi:hypothetical protein
MRLGPFGLGRIGAFHAAGLPICDLRPLLGQTGHISQVAMQCASVSGLPTADACRCLLLLLSPLLSAAGLMSDLPISC